MYDLYAFTVSGYQAKEVRALLDAVIEIGAKEEPIPEWSPAPQLEKAVDIANGQGERKFNVRSAREEAENKRTRREDNSKQREEESARSRKEAKENISQSFAGMKRSLEASSRMGAGLAQLPDGLSSKEIVVEFGDIFVTDKSIWYEGECYPRSGATATIDTAAAARSRVAAGRVLGGALLFGAAGAIVGSSAKKDEGLLFVSVELPDGLSMITSGSAKKSDAATRFVREINRRPRG